MMTIISITKELEFSIPELPGCIWYHEGDCWTTGPNLLIDDPVSGTIKGLAEEIPFGPGHDVDSFHKARVLCEVHNEWVRNCSDELRLLCAGYSSLCHQAKEIEQMRERVSRMDDNITLTLTGLLNIYKKIHLD